MEKVDNSGNDNRSCVICWSGKYENASSQLYFSTELHSSWGRVEEIIGKAAIFALEVKFLLKKMECNSSNFNVLVIDEIRILVIPAVRVHFLFFQKMKTSIWFLSKIITSKPIKWNNSNKSLVYILSGILLIVGFHSRWLTRSCYHWPRQVETMIKWSLIWNMFKLARHACVCPIWTVIMNKVTYKEHTSLVVSSSV